MHVLELLDATNPSFLSAAMTLGMSLVLFSTSRYEMSWTALRLTAPLRHILTT
jgi:hypothetical protein